MMFTREEYLKLQDELEQAKGQLEDSENTAQDLQKQMVRMQDDLRLLQEKYEAGGGSADLAIKEKLVEKELDTETLFEQLNKKDIDIAELQSKLQLLEKE